MDHHDACGRQKLDISIQFYDRHEVQLAEKDAWLSYIHETA